MTATEGKRRTEVTLFIIFHSQTYLVRFK